MVQQSAFTRAYHSFSGVDIIATFAGKTIGTLQGISYSINREKSPIYTMGSADPRAFARGKRGLAGSLVFIQFDTEPLMDELANPFDQSKQLYFLSDIDDLRPEFNTEVAIGTTGVGSEGVNFPGAGIALQESNITAVGSDQKKAIPWYPDQIPPFDIVLTAANEYGGLAVMKILGVELMNSGYGVSVDDIVSEHSYTYIAMGYLPWQSQGLHPDMVNANG